MGQTIRRLRKEKGLTQKQLADAAQVPRICIARYETGEHEPGMRNAGRLAAALGVTLDELVGDDNAIPDNR